MDIEVTGDDTDGGPRESGSSGATEGTDEALTSEASIDAVDHVLDEVEQALSRLDDGTYGRCAVCAEAIDDAHLAEVPMARTCVACAESQVATTPTGGPATAPAPGVGLSRESDR
jgi:RNA polymerase-binding transcription factor DksA